jgi:hypothetical protein
MTRSATCELLTIGHSNLAADRFVSLLQDAGVTAVADVRSVPFSRWCPWFSGKALAQRLAGETIAYIALGDALGGRPSDPRLYRDGVADYEAMAARAEFATGLERVVNEMAHHRVCLLCAEREPLDCHRCLLVGRALAARGLALGHIRPDGTIEPHAATEQRLLALPRWRRAPRPCLPPARASHCSAYQGSSVMVTRHLPPERWREMCGVPAAFRLTERIPRFTRQPHCGARRRIESA